MFFFNKKKLHEKLRGYKRIRVNGITFVIKQINPILDFRHDRIPQIFTEYRTSRVIDPKISPQIVRKNQEDMMDVLLAGIVEPEIKPNGTKNYLTPEDLFRDPSMGVKLYHAILDHSLNKFKGLKKVFFSIGTKLSCWIYIASGITNDLAVYSQKKGNSA